MRDTVIKKTGSGNIVRLFLMMMYISAFTFGGGFVIVTLMKKNFCDKLHWIDEDEMLDMTAIAQSSPGAIAVNAAIMVGWKIGGFAGMLASVLGTIIPPLITLTAVSFFYVAFASNAYVSYTLRGMQAGVAAVIFDVVFSLGGKVLKTKSVLYLLMMCAAFICTFFIGINVVYIILAAALIGVFRELLLRRRAGKESDGK